MTASTVYKVAATVLMILASFIALGNIIGCVRAEPQRGYSAVPFLSVLFSGAAWICSSDSIGFWTFIPAVLDPGTWILVILPFYLIWRYFIKRE